MKFDAILAKNDIAREVRDAIQNNEPINLNFVQYCLEQIEAYLEPSNQPSIKEIIECTEYAL